MISIVRFYRSRGIKLVKGKDQYVWDSNGKRYLDTHNGNGIGFLGHGNKYVLNEIYSLLNNNIYIASNLFDTDVLYETLRYLDMVIPSIFDSSYFLNSGSEAVELSLKIARTYTSKSKIIYFTGSFHGRTLGALSVTWNPKYRFGMNDLELKTVALPFNNIDAVEKFRSNDLAGIIVELIQGEGGLNVAKRDFIRALRDLKERTGSLLIIDEIQTGFGRTGYRWLFEEYNVEPDILLIGKAIGGGFPTSILFTRSEIIENLPRGFHGSTYGGNPLALASIKGSIKAFLNDNVLLKVKTSSSILHNRIIEIIKERGIARRVKGLGLMLGVETGKNPESIIRCLQHNGILALRSGETIVRFLPPYMINMNDIENLVNSLERCMYRDS